MTIDNTFFNIENDRSQSLDEEGFEDDEEFEIEENDEEDIKDKEIEELFGEDKESITIRNKHLLDNEED